MTIRFAMRHRFPGIRMDLAFEAPTPGITALFGPSGCGKSTALRAIAGLLRPDWCRIELQGDVLADTDAGIWVPAERRRVGVVFQDSRLFPHLSVASNLRYGLRRAGKARVGFDEVVDLLDIGPLLKRRPHALSGGEKQRVAIGRALLAQARLLLMDEPLASLDAARKAEILPFLLRLDTILHLPIVYVTHSLEEIARLVDHLVLIQEGKTAASGPLGEIAARADLPMLAQRDDAAAVLDARVLGHDEGRRLTRLAAAGTEIWVPLLDRHAGTAARIRVPAREVILAGAVPKAISVHNVLAGTVRAVVEDAPRHAALVEVALADGALLSRVTADAVGKLGLGLGAPVLALVKSVAVEVLGRE